MHFHFLDRALASAPVALPAPVTIECHGCGAVEHRRAAVLPEGWSTKAEGDDVHAFCTDCTETVPDGSKQ
ncbi:hypothetical protein [Sphingomonas sp. IC081]|uniref:hypothetical protein n=1 Tax=Sphingomonas sp. IC081 TaxID=304378 RepID=UPI0011578C35|nr:hypothetical protein [Sphingomonas sp. IC081]QDK34518.1 hypothetical protein DM450_17410 [Sphingomonas sp. IC081]